MCCFFTVLALLGPRIAIVVWWLLELLRFTTTFDNFILPLLGFLFLPWTMLMYVIIAPGGGAGFDWIWLAIAFVGDIGTYSGGGYGNRDRIPV